VEGIGGADGGAATLTVAAGAIDDEGVPDAEGGEGAVGAGGDAALDAAKTQVRVEEDLPRRALRLGVVAPPATQGATLEEDHGAQAGTVVDGEALDVEDDGTALCPAARSGTAGG